MRACAARLPQRKEKKASMRVSGAASVRANAPVAPVPPAFEARHQKACDPAAMAEFERLLMATSRVTIRGSRHSLDEFRQRQPEVGRINFDLDGTRDALSLVVNIDPEYKTRPPKKWEHPKDIEPFLVFRAELTLRDGRSVTTLSHPGVLDFRGQTSGGQRIEVQVMDRDGPVSISQDPMGEGLSGTCDPLAAHPKTRAAHPQSADETLRHGYEESAPAALNQAMIQWHTLALKCLIFPPPGAMVACLVIFCTNPPDVLYELRELRGGNVVDGVRYTAKGPTTCPPPSTMFLPDGDTIDFAGSTPLQTRKDVVLMAAYRASKGMVTHIVPSGM